MSRLTSSMIMACSANKLNVIAANAKFNNTLYLQARCYTNQKKNFLGGFFENLKEEYNKNKDMKDSIKKFRQEAQKLEESEALKEARKKFKELDDEKDKSTQVIKEKIMTIGEKVKESDLGKKAAEFTEEMAKQASKAAETVSKQTQDITNTAAFKKVSENVRAIKENIDEAAQISEVKPYKRPTKLRKRSEADETLKAKVYESNTQDTGMVLHKDSKWYQSWQNFKDNNTYVNKLFEFKNQYEESDNPVVRATRALTDRFGGIFGSMFKSTEMSEVLTEIVKMEPSFELNLFLKRVQYDIIPNVLEALSVGEIEILKDWCTETAFTIFTHPLKQCEQLQMKYHNEVLDISHVDIAASKIMEQGPVLIVTFTAQQIIYVTDSKGAVVEGDKEKIKRVHHVWALCRDQSILDPNAAWRVMECAMHASEQFV